MERIISGKLPLWANASTNGYGYGDGSGSGYGYGSGYGDGDGSGYGDGYGYGSGDGDYLNVFRSAKDSWSGTVKKRIAELEREDCVLAFWKSDKDGKPSNGGSSDVGVVPGMMQTVSGPLSLCHQGTLHATMNPDKWRGERLWVVALHGEVQWQDDKCGALRREIVGEIKLV